MRNQEIELTKNSSRRSYRSNSEPISEKSIVQRQLYVPNNFENYSLEEFWRKAHHVVKFGVVLPFFIFKKFQFDIFTEEYLISKKTVF